MADIKDRAREYLAKNSEYSEVYGEFFVAVDTMTAMIEFAEQETKELKEQIEIDAEQIRALQRQNGELTDELTKKAGTNHQLVEQLAKLNERCFELEEENAELKTKKIPQLERRIASIRGSHCVDVKKLNARIEQVERLKKENAELKTVIALKDEEMGCIETDFNTFKSQAKEIISKLLSRLNRLTYTGLNCEECKEAEQFLSEVEK